MSDKQFLHSLYSHHNSLLTNLCNELDEQQCEHVGFEIPDVTIDEDAIRQKSLPDFIPTETLVAESYRYQVTHFWEQLRVRNGASTRYVSRMPGLIAAKGNKGWLLKQINQINAVKKQIEYFVQKRDPKTGKHGRNSEEKHEFIHDVLPGVMTEQLYRKIHVLEDAVSNAWFNWTSRPVPKSIKGDDIDVYFSELKTKPKGLNTEAEWVVKIENIEHEFKIKQFDYVQKYKASSVFPTTIVQFENKELKRKTITSPTPILLLGQSEGKLPKFSELGDYHKPKDDEQGTSLKSTSFRIRSGKKEILDADLKLVGVYET